MSEGMCDKGDNKSVSSHVCCQKRWSLLTQTLELFQVFCNANITDKSIITRISALNRNSVILTYFIPPGVQEKQHPVLWLRFIMRWKVWREQEQPCGPTTALLHHLATSKEPSATQSCPGWASTPRALTPAGTQGPRSHLFMPQVGWEETWKEGKTPELGTV